MALSKKARAPTGNAEDSGSDTEEDSWDVWEGSLATLPADVQRTLLKHLDPLALASLACTNR